MKNLCFPHPIMNPMVIITDIHFGDKKNSKDFLFTQLEFFEKQFFPFLLEKNVKNVICLGDLINDRRTVNIELTNILKEKFFSFFENQGIKFYWILGNHDIYYKNSLNVNSSRLFKEFKSIIVIDEPIFDQSRKHLFIPWIIPENYNEYKEYLKLDVEKLYGHFEINGFEIIKDFKFKDGLSQSSFKSKKIYSGHFHYHQKKKNIYYIGSPFWNNWTSKNQKKGFLYIDENEKEYFIENEISPKYIEISYNEKNKINKHDIKNNIFKIKVDSKYIKDINFINFKEKLEKGFPKNIETIIFDEYDFLNLDEQNADIDSLQDIFEFEKILQDYINNIELPNYIKRENLKNLISKILNLSKEDDSSDKS